MSIVIAHHKVKDFTAWKPYYTADAARRIANGIRDLKIGTPPDDPNNVYMIWEVEDPSKIQGMIKDPDLKEMMDKAGVLSPPELIIVLNER